MPFRFRAPLAANLRMENLFERASSSRAAKYYGAKLFTIQLSIGQKNSGSELATNFFFNF